jgi:glyoxylase-like metal-dependent hydrolase (beta-lactamase superfamily II)/rhodanese-related sulfurtransferase
LFFRQILHRDLGCASYFIGCGGEAVVVDPRWDIDVYLEMAEAEHFQITSVLDTHDHADHVSGRERLAALTGARSGRAARAGDERDGDVSAGEEIAVGTVRIRALAIPGHRPEHLAFTVTDLKRGPDPWMVLTGDSLLVGDLARPDLAVDADDGAADLYESLRRLLELEDHIEVWPAHVGGSLCGGAGLSGKTASTIGYERRQQPLLQADSSAFVEGLIAGIPASRPPNIARIVKLNQSSEPIDPGPLMPLSETRLHELLKAGATVLDARHPDAFDIAHLAGAVNLPLASPGVGTRAGWALGPEEQVVIVADDDVEALAMATTLQAGGVFRAIGWVPANRPAWERAGLPVASAGSWDIERLAECLRKSAVDLVDVREQTEWDAGHVRGSHHVPLARLRDGRSVTLPDNGMTTAVACAAGMRAAFAASLLRRAGRPNVVRVANGGVPDLGGHGIPLDAGD